MTVKPSSGGEETLETVSSDCGAQTAGQLFLEGRKPAPSFSSSATLLLTGIPVDREEVVDVEAHSAIPVRDVDVATCRDVEPRERETVSERLAVAMEDEVAGGDAGHIRDPVSIAEVSTSSHDV